MLRRGDACALQRLAQRIANYYSAQGDLIRDVEQLGEQIVREALAVTS